MTEIQKNRHPFILFSALLLLQLVFLFFIKYSNQNFALSEFSFSPLGNIFNSIIFLGIISGLILSSLSEKNILLSRSIKFYLLVTWLLLVLCIISTKVKTPLNNVYILFQPADKLLAGLLFIFYLLILLIFLLNTWLRLLGNKDTTFIRGFYSGILTLFIFLLFTFIYINVVGAVSNNTTLNKPKGDKRNIAVVLGAAVWSDNQPSPTLSGRVDEALELLYEGYVQKVLLTGSNAPGEMTEADVAYEYAKSKGVDIALIEVESKTTSTNEQIRFIKNNLAMRDDIKDIIIISDSYHLPRVMEISKFYNVTVKVAASKHRLDFKDELYNKLRESVALFFFWCFAI
jgi:vancomycin permeability regulator SanA